MRDWLRDEFDEIAHDPMGWVLATAILLLIGGLTARGCL